MSCSDICADKSIREDLPLFGTMILRSEPGQTIIFRYSIFRYFAQGINSLHTKETGAEVHAEEGPYDVYRDIVRSKRS